MLKQYIGGGEAVNNKEKISMRKKRSWNNEELFVVINLFSCDW